VSLPTAAMVCSERLRRQRLIGPLEHARGYPALVRTLQPVSTGAWARPGSPPRLPHRTRFDDASAAARLRRRRELVKGRFQGGGIGYVLADDLELYANAFARPLARATSIQSGVLEAVRAAGPLTPRQLREETGLLAKQVMPALHRLQTAFLVYEDQLDDDWERPWFDFAGEWPEVSIVPERSDSSAVEVLGRFLHAHVFATPEQCASWSRWPARRVAKLLGELERSGRIKACSPAGLGEGHLCADAGRLSPPSAAPGVLVLHRQDFLTRAAQTDLERRFGKRDSLQYLLVDGELCGAVRGHWGFHPYDVDDIDLELPARELAARRAEILAAVRAAYPEPRHHVLRYAGKAI